MSRRRPGSGRVSQADVARRAGVSAGIVSSVVNDRSYGIRVSDATRQRVWEAVRELGYVPNLAARSLAGGSNRLIAVFTYQPVFPYESRDFYHEFLTGLEAAAEETSHNLLMVTGARTAEGARSVYAGGVNNLQLADGAVLLGSGESPEELERLSADRYPFVYIGQRRPAGVELSYVAADYRGGTAQVVAELAARGHRRIAMVLDAGEGEPVPGRRPGFEQGCEEAGITGRDRPVLTLARSDAAPGAERVADPDALVALAPEQRLSALVVERADEASAIRAAARRAGVRVPGELSVVSLGVGPEPSDVAELGRMHIPRREMGRRAVLLLLQLLGRSGAASSPTDRGEGSGSDAVGPPPAAEGDAAASSRPLRATLPCTFEPGLTVGPPTS